MSNLIEYARVELEAIGAFSEEKDFYGGMTGNSVIELIELFSKQGHSGMSAGLVRNLFNKLADYQPLKPLTGEDSEWGRNDMDGKTLQNKRCSHVFKNTETDECYDIDGKIFREPDGCTYISRDSRVSVTFPYIPKSEIVDVPKSKED